MGLPGSMKADVGGQSKGFSPLLCHWPFHQQQEEKALAGKAECSALCEASGIRVLLSFRETEWAQI
jgi:hypothetical protein